MNMKNIAKKIILIWMVLLSSVFARAQYSSVMVEDATLQDGGSTIVRKMSNTEVVTYFKGETSHRFTYENNSALTYIFRDLPPTFNEITVLDFKIIKDIVYFCGKNSNSGMGVLGTFFVLDLINTSLSSMQVDYFEISNTTELNRIEAYIDPVSTMPRLAAVGYNRFGPCGPWACGIWVDCEGYMPGSPPISCTVFESFYSALDVEQWSDVVLTDKWVVLVGFGDVGGQQGLMLRRFHKGMPTDPEIDNIYIFNEYDQVVWDETRAVFLKNNDIAVVYRGDRNTDVTDFTRFRVFDINNMVNINSQEYEVPHKSYIREMAYMEEADRVVLLNDFSTPVILSNFAYLIPYQTTSYTSVYVHDKEWRFMSLTNLDDYFFVGAGSFHFLMRDATASYPASNIYLSPGAPVLCPIDEVLKVKKIRNIIPRDFPMTPPMLQIMPIFGNGSARMVGPKVSGILNT